MLGTGLIVVLILILVGALPSRRWDYYPSGVLGLILAILVILLILGRV